MQDNNFDEIKNGKKQFSIQSLFVILRWNIFLFKEKNVLKINVVYFGALRHHNFWVGQRLNSKYFIGFFV